jgi:hypothetical protein
MLFVPCESLRLHRRDARCHAEAELSLRIDRSVCPGRPLPTKLGLLLDAFPLSPPLAERLESCGIDRDFRKGQKPSDHAPLLGELRD